MIAASKPQRWRSVDVGAEAAVVSESWWTAAATGAKPVLRRGRSARVRARSRRRRQAPIVVLTAKPSATGAEAQTAGPGARWARRQEELEAASMAEAPILARRVAGGWRRRARRGPRPASALAGLLQSTAVHAGRSGAGQVHGGRGGPALGASFGESASDERQGAPGIGRARRATKPNVEPGGRTNAAAARACPTTPSSYPLHELTDFFTNVSARLSGSCRQVHVSPVSGSAHGVRGKGARAKRCKIGRAVLARPFGGVWEYQQINPAL